jgi:hypothetical protein
MTRCLWRKSLNIMSFPLAQTRIAQELAYSGRINDKDVGHLRLTGDDNPAELRLSTCNDRASVIIPRGGLKFALVMVLKHSSCQLSCLYLGFSF